MGGGEDQIKEGEGQAALKVYLPTIFIPVLCRSGRDFQTLQKDHLPLEGGRDIPRGHPGEGRVFDSRKGGFDGD